MTFSAAARRRAGVIALVCGVSAIAGVAACEHAKHSRGGEPWPTSFVKRVSNPHAAEAELQRRMAPAAPKLMPDAPAGEEAYKDAGDYIRRTSAGCISCHGETDEPDMHTTQSLAVSCVDCHGGDGGVLSTLTQPGRPGRPGTPIDDNAYLDRMTAAHIQPRNPSAWYGHDLLDGRSFGEHGHEHRPLHGSRTPQNTYALLNQESPEFIRFINPGDLRVARFACGSCHAEQVAHVPHSMMAHGPMLWGAAMYNNGAVPHKTPRYGESYSPFGLPQRLVGVVELNEAGQAEARLPTVPEARRGVLTYLDPLQPWNISQPGNMLRIFERGTKLPVPGGPTPNVSPAEIGIANPLVEGGRPDKGLSPRGLGTLNRTDPVFLGLQKTRLLDPTLQFFGTNDHPGDFRASGCTSCHSIYANDRAAAHSGPLAAFGHLGHSASNDPTLPKDESGHPIKHVLTNAVPNSQCIVCHIHPGTLYANTYLGYMWWDNESDGEHMYPATSHNPTPEQEWAALRKNPEAAQLKGLWGNLYPDAVSHAGEKAGTDFLEKIGEPPGAEGAPPVFNDKLEHNQFADFHGHGWVFRAVHKKDRRGNLLDQDGNVIDPDDPRKWDKTVHLQDVHLQKGMHCVDCHFSQDNHGDGRLYGESRNATEITCTDCHGTYSRKIDLRTSGRAAPAGGADMSKLRISVRSGLRESRRFYEKGGLVYQRSAIDPNLEWLVPQTVDTLDPDSKWSKDNPEAARASRFAKTLRRDGKTWGSLPEDKPGAGHHGSLAHGSESMECYTCHTSWMTSCSGCHLPMRANQRAPMLHNENLFTRNFTQYNFQVLRDDMFMLGHDGVYKSGQLDDAGNLVKPGKIVPVRSSSAVLVSSQNQNREWVYHQQQTVSGEGYSGQAFNPHYPHAVSGRGTTKTCADCHVSRENDNNAWMAQLLLQGTNFVNFFGRYVYVATGSKGLEAVAVTEHDEPQAVYGSNLHRLAYPDEHKALEGAGRRLRESYHHAAGGGGEVLDVQLRGEYLYAALGRGGFYAYDVANIDNKGFSERIVTAPVSPLGQRLGFDTKYAVAVASPSTLAVDPARSRHSADPSKPRATIMDPTQPWHINYEQPIHPMYAYLYIGDREEGLILTEAATLLDGDPTNNFLERAEFADGSKAFNPDKVLTGLTSLAIAGHYVYATCNAGLVVIDIDQPLDPKVVAVVGSITGARSVAIQFRYAFVTNADGLKVVDVTEPTAPRLVEGALIPLDEAHRVYVARTYAFVAAGKDGVAIVDVTNPEKPRLDQMFTADGKLDDTRDVKVGMTNASLFAYVADGRRGLKVVELMGPHTAPQFRGFSPPLAPRLIAEYHTHGPALAISKGLDRDRAVDESGHQVAVFGRIGARPMGLEGMRRMYLRDGQLWTVTGEPETDPEKFSTTEAKKGGASEIPARPGPKRPGPKRPGKP